MKITDLWPVAIPVGLLIAGAIVVATDEPRLPLTQRAKAIPESAEKAGADRRGRLARRIQGQGFLCPEVLSFKEMPMDMLAIECTPLPGMEVWYLTDRFGNDAHGFPGFGN